LNFPTGEKKNEGRKEKKGENKNGSGRAGIRAFAAAIALVLERCTVGYEG